jgi:hypothetical protein
MLILVTKKRRWVWQLLLKQRRQRKRTLMSQGSQLVLVRVRVTWVEVVVMLKAPSRVPSLVPLYLMMTRAQASAMMAMAMQFSEQLMRRIKVPTKYLNCQVTETERTELP